MSDLLWPTYDGPGDLAAIEAVPLADRGLPGTTYELLVRAAGLWPDRVALSVLPDGERWEQKLVNQLGPVELWALSTTPADTALRGRLYDRVGFSEGLRRRVTGTEARP